MQSSTSDRRIERALVSVSDKTGIVELTRRLAARGVEILSTGGTARTLREAGIEVVDIAEFTGSPEILDGRVKTLHPKVHGGLLFIRDNAEHRRTAEEHAIRPIDLVVVNLYPFRETIATPGVTRAEAVEQIDIGGPSMVRSAAKNHAAVTIVCSPQRYAEVLDEIETHDGRTTLELRQRLALEAFRHTADYDAAIAAWFERQLSDAALPERVDGTLPEDRRLSIALRYGENPHQAAGFYGDLGRHFEKLWGKDLSYNNILDLSAAVELVEEFGIDEDRGDATAAVSIIKHTNPCGVALGSSVLEAWERALSTDRDSANGGIVAVNRPLDEDAARVIHPFFTEIIVAPEFAPEALELLKKKSSRRLIRARTPLADGHAWRLRSAAGGLLVQEADHAELAASELRVVTERAPSDAELAALQFAWKVVKHLKSNAIAFTSADRSLGLGAGQMSRVDAARIAILKARNAGLDLAGSVVASDAFFPFADGLVTCAEAGARAVIQPGGSVRDEEVVAAANERGVAMVFTGRRHFRH